MQWPTETLEGSVDIVWVCPSDEADGLGNFLLRRSANSKLSTLTLTNVLHNL